MPDFICDIFEKPAALIIDGNQSEREKMKHCLDDLDFRVSSVGTVKSAMRSLRSSSPDLIILPEILENDYSLNKIPSLLESLEGKIAVGILAGQKDITNDPLKDNPLVSGVYLRPIHKRTFCNWVKKVMGMDRVYVPEPKPFREGIDEMSMFERVYAMIDPLGERMKPNDIEKEQFFRNFEMLEKTGQEYMQDMVSSIISRMWGNRKLKIWVSDGEKRPYAEITRVRDMIEFYAANFPKRIEDRLPENIKDGLKNVRYLRGKNPPKRWPDKNQLQVYQDLESMNGYGCNMQVYMLEDPKNVPLYMIQVRNNKGYDSTRKKLLKKIDELVAPPLSVFDARRLKYHCFNRTDYFAMTLFTAGDEEVESVDNAMMDLLRKEWRVEKYRRTDRLHDPRKTYIQYKVPIIHPINMEVLIGSFETRAAVTEMFGPNRRANYAKRMGKLTR